MSDIILERIANAVENLDNGGYTTVKVEFSDEDYYMFNQIQIELARIADALSNKEEG